MPKDKEPIHDITGQRFGMLTAIRREKSKNGKTQWLCACDCGEERVVATSLLKSGKIRHCGCLANRIKYTRKLDLHEKRFGRLVTVRMTDKRTRKGSVIWACHCDCGNDVEVPADYLMQGNYVSCGCRKQELKDSIGEHLTFVDGTCVEWLRSRKHRSDNTSGFRGISKSRNGKWKVGIGLRGERYHIGTFDTFEEAQAARLEAEKKLHDDFILAWEKWNLLADSNPEWTINNPFIFEVKKINGAITVYAPILDDDMEDGQRG